MDQSELGQTQFDSVEPSDCAGNTNVLHFRTRLFYPCGVSLTASSGSRLPITGCRGIIEWDEARVLTMAGDRVGRTRPMLSSYEGSHFKLEIRDKTKSFNEGRVTTECQPPRFMEGLWLAWPYQLNQFAITWNRGGLNRTGR